MKIDFPAEGKTGKDWKRLEKTGKNWKTLKNLQKVKNKKNRRF